MIVSVNRKWMRMWYESLLRLIFIHDPYCDLFYSFKNRAFRSFPLPEVNKRGQLPSLKLIPTIILFEVAKTLWWSEKVASSCCLRDDRSVTFNIFWETMSVTVPVSPTWSSISHILECSNYAQITLKLRLNYAQLSAQKGSPVARYLLSIKNFKKGLCR